MMGFWQIFDHSRKFFTYATKETNFFSSFSKYVLQIYIYKFIGQPSYIFYSLKKGLHFWLDASSQHIWWLSSLLRILNVRNIESIKAKPWGIFWKNQYIWNNFAKEYEEGWV